MQHYELIWLTKVYPTQCEDKLRSLFLRYALDWDSGRVRVMLGKSGKVVCTLEVSRQYPAQSRVELIGVEGAEYDPRLNTLQVCS